MFQAIARWLMRGRRRPRLTVVEEIGNLPWQRTFAVTGPASIFHHLHVMSAAGIPRLREPHPEHVGLRVLKVEVVNETPGFWRVQVWYGEHDGQARRRR